MQGEEAAGVIAYGKEVMLLKSYIVDCTVLGNMCI
jgi:hypothetical protein